MSFMVVQTSGGSAIVADSDLAVTVRALTVREDVVIGGDTTLAGGKVGYTANDSAGAGFRYVKVPNA